MRACFLFATIIALPASLAGQQESSAPRAPDVHFVPTEPGVVRAMLGAAQVGPKDVVYDLGCGDGRIVIRAVKRYGARGVCVDIDPVRIAESRRNADTAGVAGRITFREGDLFEMDLSKASVVALYLLPALNERLRPKLFRELRPGSRIVSNAFDMGDWKADSILRVNPVEPFPSFAYFWVMPADVAGTWNVSVTEDGAKQGKQVYQIRLDQRYQQITGTGSASERPVSITDERLRGDRLSLTVHDSIANRPAELRLSGRVTGDRAVGTASNRDGSRTGAWSAVRSERGSRPELQPAAATDTTGR
ncbi:MAG TPA: class I SAM-dependent methyltransferase [Gemmatimonadales bacterium]|nr:class I SAM-dependent methyltransferase [Gemmatimonadales bacterium]